MKKKGNRANTPNRTNEPKFTRGPWYVKPRELVKRNYWPEFYTRTTILDNPEKAYSPRHVIATVARTNGRDNENARLIAAAPDMYNSNETTLQEITEIFSGLNAACGKCMRYLEIGNKACRTCAAHKALKIAEQMKNRISKLQQKARGEQEE